MHPRIERVGHSVHRAALDQQQSNRFQGRRCDARDAGNPHLAARDLVEHPLRQKLGRVL